MCRAGHCQELAGHTPLPRPPLEEPPCSTNTPELEGRRRVVPVSGSAASILTSAHDTGVSSCFLLGASPMEEERVGLPWSWGDQENEHNDALMGETAFAPPSDDRPHSELMLSPHDSIILSSSHTNQRRLTLAPR